MILRHTASTLHLISQPDHAALARRVMERWAPLHDADRRASILLAIEEHDNALVVPKTAVVDYSSQRGVWVPNDQDRAMFVPLKLGIENNESIEVLEGLAEGAKFVNNGAGAVRNNDQLLIAGQPGGGQGGPGRGPGRGNAGDGARKFQGGQGQRPGGGQPPAPGGEGQPARKRPQ